MTSPTALTEFTDELIQKELEKFDSLDLSPIFGLIDGRYEYQGFQPKQHLKSLLKKKGESNVADDVFQSDIVKMIAMFLKIGNPNPNNLKKRAPEVSADVDMMKLRYGIAVSAQGKSSSVITIPRIAATFATLTMRVAQRIGVRDYSGPFGSASLPWFMKVTVFPAVIPHEFPSNLKTILLNAFMGFSVEQTLAISKRPIGDLDKIFSEQKNIIMSIHSTTIPNANARTEFAKTIDWASAIKPIMEITKVMMSKIPALSDAPSTRFLKPLLIEQGFKPAEESGAPQSRNGKDPAVEGNDSSDSENEEEKREEEERKRKKLETMYYPEPSSSAQRKAFKKVMVARGYEGTFIRMEEKLRPKIGPDGKMIFPDPDIPSPVVAEGSGTK